MYTIILKNDKGLYASHKETIMQYSNLVDKIQFLVPTQIGDNIMSDFDTVLLEYISPVTKQYKTEFLTLSEELYKGHLQYFLPFDTKITAESGIIEMRLSFYKTTTVDNDGESETSAYIFKTQPCHLNVTAVSDWSSFISNDTLSALDKKIVQLIALQKEIEDMQSTISDYQENLINDDIVSEGTTYSSKKIEEFIDQSELEETIEDIEAGNVLSIENSAIDSLFENESSDDSSDETSNNEDVSEITQ